MSNGCDRTYRTSAFAGAALALTALLAACGGGGGGTGGPNPTTAPSTPTPPPTTTNAVGTLVDDASGAPLANVKVQLAPWTAYPTPAATASAVATPTPLTTTTTNASGQFTISAANGKYLLIIGDDDPTYPSGRPTIHDAVTLSGQTVLAAPTMPPIPLVTPLPNEVNGKYRLTTIDQTNEVPCITDYDQQRVTLGLPKAVIDEWLTENMRAALSSATNPATATATPNPLYPYGYLTSGSTAVSGGSSCMSVMTSPGAFSTGSYAYNAQALWFAGSYITYTPPGASPQGYGIAEFPIDPRVFTDPNAQPWL